MNWRKSSHSYSNGNCVEVGAWRVPSRSAGNGACVEVGRGPAAVGVRDSRDPGGPVLAFSDLHWAAFLARVCDGQQPRLRAAGQQQAR